MTTKVRPSTLENTGVTAGTYGGSATQTVIIVDAQGRVTSAANVSSAIPTSQLSGTISSTQVAAGTYDISINGNAGTVGSLSVHSGRNNEANKVVRTDGSGYLQTGYINSSSGDENNSSNPDRVWGTNGSDSYLRTYRTSSLSVNYAGSAGSAGSAGYVEWTNVGSKPSLMRKIKSYTTGYLGDPPSMNDGGLPWASTSNTEMAPVNRNWMFSNASYSLSIPTPLVGGSQAFRPDYGGGSVWWGGTLAINASWLGENVLNLRYATAIRSGSNVVWTGYNATTDSYRIFCGDVVHSYNESFERTTYIPLYIAFSRRVYHNYYGFYTPTTWPYALQVDFYGD